MQAEPGSARVFSSLTEPSHEPARLGSIPALLTLYLSLPSWFASSQLGCRAFSSPKIAVAVCFGWFLRSPCPLPLHRLRESRRQAGGWCRAAEDFDMLLRWRRRLFEKESNPEKGRRKEGSIVPWREGTHTSSCPLYMPPARPPLDNDDTILCLSPPLHGSLSSSGLCRAWKLMRRTS